MRFRKLGRSGKINGLKTNSHLIALFVDQAVFAKQTNKSSNPTNSDERSMHHSFNTHSNSHSLRILGYRANLNMSHIIYASPDYESDQALEKTDRSGACASDESQATYV